MRHCFVREDLLPVCVLALLFTYVTSEQGAPGDTLSVQVVGFQPLRLRVVTRNGQQVAEPATSLEQARGPLVSSDVSQLV